MQKKNWDVVLPKLQYCRVIRRLCDNGVICGRLNDNSSPYDAVDRHFCNFFPPCERDFRIESADDDIVYWAVITPRRIGLPVAVVALFVRSCKLGIDETVPDDGPPHSPFIWIVVDIWFSGFVFGFRMCHVEWNEDCGVPIENNWFVNDNSFVYFWVCESVLFLSV